MAISPFLDREPKRKERPDTSALPTIQELPTRSGLAHPRGVAIYRELFELLK